MKRLLVLAILSFPFVVSAEIPAFPMAFWGNVTINGSSAPVGTIIRAYYGSDLAGSITVQETGVYGYTEPTKQKLVIKEGSGAITFKVQSSSFNDGAETAGNSALSHDSFTSASTTQLNLAFTIPVPTPPASGGSGGGGGGGGGGSTSVTTTLTSTLAQKIDGNKDGKVDVLDFNTLMVNWGSVSSSNIADFTGDGKVDVLDFNALMVHWTG